MKEQNFTGEYLQGIERVGWGCVILLRSILTLSKTCDVDVKFAKEVSSSSRKGKMQMQLYYNGPHSVDTPNRQLGHFLR